ncbi:MAG: nitroreductase family protein [Candidatus Altiarchaeota archaeon]
MSKDDKQEPECLIDLIKRRRTCRFFKPVCEVPDKDINLILEAARWAPSARNLQPIEFVIVRDPQELKKLSVFARQNQPMESSVSVIVIGDLKRAKAVGDVSPHDVTTHFKGIKMFIYMDAAAAIQNMLLMAEALGYNTLWIASFDEDGLEDFMKLPQRFIPLSIICVGKKSKDLIIPPKRNLNTRVHKEVWSPKDQDESYIGFSKKINRRY